MKLDKKKLKKNLRSVHTFDCSSLFGRYFYEGHQSPQCDVDYLFDQYSGVKTRGTYLQEYFGDVRGYFVLTESHRLCG